MGSTAGVLLARGGCKISVRDYMAMILPGLSQFDDYQVLPLLLGPLPSNNYLNPTVFQVCS